MISVNDVGLASLIELVARALFGEPNRAMSSRTELRFGTNGSLSVDLRKGVWKDFESDEGGGVLDLVQRGTGITEAREQFEWMEERGIKEPDKRYTQSARPEYNQDRPRNEQPRQEPLPDEQLRTRRDEQFTAYNYEDAQGNFVSQVVRIEWYENGNRKKTFRQRRKGQDGKWINNLDDVTPPLYRLPELLGAVSQQQPVFIVEGEKDVENLRALGIPATCNIGGAGKWRDEYNETFRDADVIVISDNDPPTINAKGETLLNEDGSPRRPGQDHAKRVADALLGTAARVRVLDLGAVWLECPLKGDVSDWIENGGDAAQLYKIIDQTPNYLPATDSPSIQAEPIELFDPWQRYVVPAFPLEVLPPIIRQFVATQSEIIGCDKSALAMAVLAALSGAIDHQFALKIMRNGDWWASPRLWVLLVGDPSIKKTPIMNTASGRIDELQAAAWRKYQNDKKDYVDGGGDPEAFDAPEPPRFVAYDVTVEKLGMILAEQDRGILIKRDEIVGWVGSMEKYTSGRAASADRAFWLKAYDGGPFTVDRVSRSSIRIRNLSVSIIGGIQPARLAELQGLTSDGLLQRFIPVMVSGSTFPMDRPVSDEAERYWQLIERLISVAPQRLILEDDAVPVMEDLRRYLFDLERAAAGIADGFQSFVGKLSGLAGSLTLILAIAEDPERAPAARVSKAVVEAMATLIKEFVLPHAFEFYRTTGAASDRLQRIASWILTSGKTRIVPSDLTVNVADMRGLGIWDVNQRVSPLVAGGWLTPAEPGPLAKAWTVNPAVRDFFQERAKEEERRKMAVAELMNATRTRRDGKS